MDMARDSKPRELGPPRPPLKWAGGKRWLVPHLRLLWTGHESQRLVEPFCGGLATTLGLAPRSALISDVNPHLINFYLWLQKGLRFGLNFRNTSEDYYAARDRFNELIAENRALGREGAGLFYYLNRTGFNGLCRFNQSGEYNIPYGRHKKITYHPDLRVYAKSMTGWGIVCGDFQSVPLKADDFVYADPPYDSSFSQYSSGGFSWEDHDRLAQWLSKHTGPVVISNRATARVIELYKQHGFDITRKLAPRLISCTGDRTRVWEVIATRNIRTVE